MTPEYRKIGNFTDWIVFRGLVIVEAGKLPALIAVANICLAMSDT